MSSRALEADATQTSLCAYLSVIALAGVALNACARLVVGRSGGRAGDGADHRSKEGIEGVRGEAHCDDECC